MRLGKKADPVGGLVDHGENFGFYSKCEKNHGKILSKRGEGSGLSLKRRFGLLGGELIMGMQERHQRLGNRLFHESRGERIMAGTGEWEWRC